MADKPNPAGEGGAGDTVHSRAASNNLQIARQGRKSKRFGDLFAEQGRPRDFNAEARLQADCVQLIRLASPQCLAFAVPNGGLRSKAEAARLKWTGTLAGVPDVIVLAPVGRIFCLEFKTLTGRLSPAQRAVFDQLVALGVPCAVIRSLDDLIKAFATWNIPMRVAR
jgi:hypothetical protein